MEDGIPHGGPSMSYPYMLYQPNDGLLATNQTPQPQPAQWFRPNVPASIAQAIAELDAQFGLTPANIIPQTTYYPSGPSIARQETGNNIQTYDQQYAAPSFRRIGHVRVRNHQALVRPPYPLPSSSGHIPRAERVLFPRGAGDHNSRPDPSFNAVQRAEMSTPHPSTEPRSIQTGSHSPDMIPPSVEDEEVKAVIHNLVPDMAPECVKMRTALWDVMKAPWKLENQVEPEPNILLQFMQKDGKVWKCLLYNDGRPCTECSAKKRIQALEHIRLHIDLKPFACVGEACRLSAEGCHKRYCSKDRLRKHRLAKVRCDLCGKEYLEGNLQRHKAESCPGSNKQ